MVKIVWTELSVEDLREIFDYISKNSTLYARITVDRIFKRADQISTNPKSGRIVPEINNESLRELIMGKYKLIYYIVNEYRIDILKVYHSARSFSDSDVK
jgi:addiction module RelE/StbE family toxin